ncbi:AmmeMemoRadiSam system radical SAM enzyme [Methanoplanus sp. FWC-SCC4]|uniref:AmmeMemoRadiSam system radical SAM enzyme n=1 Tax=Methanochimaera problematica TaxID=2609417 RepID=A0AA97FCI6_9EURY|nr:AmmeMemoRadiSam system radical SAM enzyme [Methanoplanus sp. FWC-SCC4]WOF16449.1 AmmeMemoRadiSam system radical SAM enzyme [Methanoplanus sp. FWC-SCC4]
MHEAHLYDCREDGFVKCNLCSHRCLIGENKTGICGVRENNGCKLFSKNYGMVSAEAVDPVEKKPLFHYLPGTDVYSLGGVGCNFRCLHCQNWQISQTTSFDYLQEISPEKGVLKAIANNCKSIAWTYNEPTIWHEYALDMGRMAKKNNLGTIYVTNGYMTEEALRELSVMLDAFRVDIKAFSEKFYHKVCRAKLQPVLDATIIAKELGMHIETVNLVIPGLNDSEDEVKSLIAWVLENLGENTPMHFTRFHPDYKMTDVASTPVLTLERIYETARDMGIKYPYLGNVMDHKYCNTYCHECGSLLIQRSGYNQRNVDLKGSYCQKCGEKIPIVIHP